MRRSTPGAGWEPNDERPFLLLCGEGFLHSRNPLALGRPSLWLTWLAPSVVDSTRPEFQSCLIFFFVCVLTDSCACFSPPLAASSARTMIDPESFCTTRLRSPRPRLALATPHEPNTRSSVLDVVPPRTLRWPSSPLALEISSNQGPVVAGCLRGLARGRAPVLALEWMCTRGTR